MNNYRAPLAYLLGITIASLCARAECASSFNVRDYGAKGDGNTLDTTPLTKAIEACAAAGGGQVLVPPGKYLTGTVRLKSNVTILLDAGAELIGTPDLDQYQNFTPPAGYPLVANLRWHRAMILGEGVENVTITGRGVINGNNVSDAQGEEGVRGPHALLLGNCKNITLRDISIRDAANYAVLLEFTSHVEVRGVKITGGYDGVHFRGWKDDPCRDVSITDCEFYTGDDCIAGWYWKDTLIDRCVLNSACNGIRLFGPAKNLIVHNCLFFGPGRYEWRTSGLLHHKSMAAGLCLQPSAWGPTEGAVDDVHISDVVMHDVGTPLHMAAKSPSTIGHVTIDRLSATGVYRAAASIESWAEQPIARVDLRDSSIQFVGGFGPIWSQPAEAAVAFVTQQSAEVNPPGVNSRPLPAWGLYARHVTSLNLSDVRLDVVKKDARPAIILDGVDALDVDSLRWPSGMRRPMVLQSVRHITQSGSTIPIVETKCLSLTASPDYKTVTATVQSGQNGLAKIELKLDGRTITRWAWLVADEKVDVVFVDLPQLDRERRHEMVCGSIRAEVKASSNWEDKGQEQ
ncbi:MAG TPA: glycosyl hydrolase family 28-related protein [Anaerolineales bacterium]|nr:glycosyl hydrolase family 28-related protein [Anaerolineales bacterium]